MTEELWLTTDRVPDLLQHVRRRGDKADRNRRLRLFGCAVMRADWDKLGDDRLRHAVSSAEEYADGELDAADAALLRHTLGNTFFHWLKTDEVENCYHLLQASMAEVARSYTHIDQSPEMAAVVRDLFGNPFRPAPFDKAWRTSSAIALAKTMYAGRDFSAMPILSDALQDAGCDDADILAHCRGSGRDRGEPVGGSPHATAVHVRGCWLVDLVLGKA